MQKSQELDLTIYTKSGKLRKRKPKQKRNYFTQDTEDAILEYIATTDQEKRDKIYKERIEYSFFKLAEFIINTFKFYHRGTDSIEDHIQELVFFMLTKLGEYDQSRGKAYSFFGTIIKRKCIVMNKTNYALSKKIKELDEQEVEEDKNIILKSQVREEQADIAHFFELYYQFLKDHFDFIFMDDVDKEIARVFLKIFENVQNLDIFNKQAFYMEVREKTGYTTQHITKVVKLMKFVFKDKLNDYYRDGTLYPYGQKITISQKAAL